MSKETYGFRHYSNTKRDMRILAMLYDYEIGGYGLYWIIIEMLSEAKGNKLPINLQIDGCEFNIPEYIEKCISIYRLFDSDGTYFWSSDFKFRDLHSLKTERLYNKDVKLWYKIRHQIFERDNYTCQYCGKRGGKLEVDHVCPISKGGTNEFSNLVTACRRCNRQKKDKTVAEFK